MAIWFKNYTLEDIKIPPTGIDEKLGIEIVEIGSDYIICKMPVDERKNSLWDYCMVELLVFLQKVQRVLQHSLS